MNFWKIAHDFAGDFIVAAGSAVILIVASLLDYCWPLFFFGLVPFFWRITQVHACRGICLGTIVAGCFAGVIYADYLMIKPLCFIIIIFAAATMTSAIIYIILRSLPKFGFFPPLVAVICLPFACCSLSYLPTGLIFNEPNATLIKLCASFGSTAVLVIIILINAIIFLIARHIYENTAIPRINGFIVAADEFMAAFQISFTPGPDNYIPNRRAPPQSAGPYSIN